MQNVMVETPYTGGVERNEDYARRCMVDSLRRGEAPIAGYLLYAQVLNHGNETERKLGIGAHLAWLRFSSKVVVYIDLGVSSDMRDAIEAADIIGIPIERRKLPGYDG